MSGGLGLRLLALAILPGLAGAGIAAPLPPPRPPGFGRAPAPPVAAPAPTAPADPPAGVSSCLAELRARGVVAEIAAPPGGAGPVCAVVEPVRLLSIADPAAPGRVIALPDAPVTACRFALAFAGWTAGVAAPVLQAAQKAALRAVRTGPGFECRPRNRQAGAKLSAHGTGLALDVAAFEFADGKVLPIRPGAEQPGERALAAIRTAACGWFTTVLGPGSDPFHTDHLHLDIILHGSSDRYRICQ